MRRQDKRKNIEQANLMLEQSYLKSKSLLKENSDNPLENSDNPLENLKSTWEKDDMYRIDFFKRKNEKETPGLQLDINGVYFHYSLEKLHSMQKMMEDYNLKDKYPKLYNSIGKAQGRIKSLLLSGEPGNGDNIEMSSFSDRKTLRDFAKESIEEMEKELNSVK
jgi:hypothetical protein